MDVKLGSWDESNSVVVLVEVRVVLSHEGISEDEVVEASREVLSHDGKHALSVFALSYLENIVVGSKCVLNVVNIESNLRKLVKTRAILVHGDTVDKGLNESIGADED
jgi:hypothetical protein